jgi:hypothetical protein
MAHVVTVVGFHLDHISAEFGEDLGGEGSHHHCGEVENSDSVQRAWHDFNLIEGF